MNSSFSMLADGLLETLSSILDMLDQLHTVSIEFTVMRENKLPIGLECTFQCLLAEQKPRKTKKQLERDVNLALAALSEHKKQLRQTVS